MSRYRQAEDILGSRVHCEPEIKYYLYIKLMVNLKVLLAAVCGFVIVYSAQYRLFSRKGSDVLKCGHNEVLYMYGGKTEAKFM